MILGILRERLLVTKFFACCRPSLDVYYAAFRLPDMLFQLVAIGALSAAFIPVFNDYLEHNQKNAYHYIIHVGSFHMLHLIDFISCIAVIVIIINVNLKYYHCVFIPITLR